MTNSNIPYVQVDLTTGRCDAMIYPLQHGDSMRIKLNGNFKVVARGINDTRNQTVYQSGWFANDWLINKYRLKKMTDTESCHIWNNRTSQLYDVYEYMCDGIAHSLDLGQEYVFTDGPHQDMTLEIRARDDMYLVIFNLGKRITQSMVEIADTVFTWFCNVTVEFVETLVEGVRQYVIPRVSLVIGQYLLTLLQQYLLPAVQQYIADNAADGANQYYQSIAQAQPIIEEVQDAIIPVPA